jgi:hypothetical protein
MLRPPNVFSLNVVVISGPVAQAKPNLWPELSLVGRATQREAKSYQTRDRCVQIRTFLFSSKMPF